MTANVEFEALIGKRVVIGLNLVNEDGSLRGKRQRHGTVTIADAEGIVIDTADGQLNVPPVPRAFVPARHGVYRLHSTGEEVNDPDYETIWNVWCPDTPDEWWQAVSVER